MEETGIIMSGDHPKLILDGSKTMTRRTWGLKEINEHPDAWERCGFDNSGRFSFRFKYGDRILNIRCPYGQVGDRLWVRETHAKRQLPSGGEQILYKAQFEELVEMFDLNEFAESRGYPPPKPLWKPSIHMFRKDSRITLEITELRAERVQEITENDAIAEGTVGLRYMNKAGQTVYWDYRVKKQLYPVFEVGVFASLWDSLNAKRGYGWDFNPWVFPIGFRKMEVEQ